MDTGEAKICSVNHQAQDREESMVQKSKGSLLKNSFLLREVNLFVLFRPSTDFMRPTYFIESNLIYPKFINLNVNFIHKQLPN